MSSIELLFHNPYEFIFLLSLLLSVLSIWILPSSITLILLGLSCLIGFMLDHISLIGIFGLIVMGFFIKCYYHRQFPLWCKIILGSFLTIAIPMYFLHFLPGFNNLRLINGVQLSPDAIPFNLYLNSDKIIVGILLLLYGHKLNRTSKEWLDSIRVILPALCFVTVVLIGGSLALNYVHFDFKLPTELWIFIPVNLLFVCMAEEAFFRGFIQKELVTIFNPIENNNLIKKWAPIIIAAFLFGLAHYMGGLNYIILATMAGIGYGYVYHKSQRIESSIILHFTINLIHFICFSYPALQPS